MYDICKYLSKYLVKQTAYRKIGSSRQEFELFGSQYIKIKFPLHKQYENAWV